MMYVIYNKKTKCVERIDTSPIVPDEEFDVLEKDINLDDDICLNMPIYKVNDNDELYIDEGLVKQHKLNILRDKREPLLKAFDIYKSNLLVGAISLPENEKQEVITWYNLILDLDADAISNPPEIISKYIQ